MFYWSGKELVVPGFLSIIYLAEKFVSEGEERDGSWLSRRINKLALCKIKIRLLEKFQIL